MPNTFHPILLERGWAISVTLLVAFKVFCFREKSSHLPIILLTAKDGVTDKVLGLDAGADDYITKPFSFDELTARIRAIFRRGKKADATILALGDLSLDPATKTAKRGKHTIVLTTREYALLKYFLRNPNTLLKCAKMGGSDSPIQPH